VPQGLFRTVTDIGSVVISDSVSAGPVTIATWLPCSNPTSSNHLQRLNGQDAVGLSITANSDANTVQVADAVQANSSDRTPSCRKAPDDDHQRPVSLHARLAGLHSA